MEDIEEYQKIFMERLKDLRDDRRYSHEKLAEKLNISVSTMSRLERGDTLPKFENLIELSKIFNVSIDYLVGISDKPKISKVKTKGRSTVTYNAREAVDEEKTITTLEKQKDIISKYSADKKEHSSEDGYEKKTS